MDIDDNADVLTLYQPDDVGEVQISTPKFDESRRIRTKINFPCLSIYDLIAA